jgi:hypothetical protein
MPIQETLQIHTSQLLESGLENLFSQIKKEIPLKVAVKRTRENNQAGQVGQADVLANLEFELARLSEQTKAFDTILEQVGSVKTKMGQEIIDAYPNTSLFTFNRIV